MDKDYYKILGVAEFETAENIKSAYRKLARKWHPDVAGNNPDAVLRFKEINEAYNVLSDVCKRSEYDKARHFYNYAKQGYSQKQEYTNNTNAGKNYTSNNHQTNPNQGKTENFNWQEFIQSFRTQNTSAPKPKKGTDIYTEIEVTTLDVIQGTEKIINMLQTSVCPKCGGRKFVNGSICHHCNGKGESINHKRFTVKIPKGIKNGSKIRLSGEGEPGEFGGINGDLYITILVKDAGNYTTDGLNILKTVPITPAEAVLGGDIRINTINGNYTVKIAPNTQNGQKIRLSGCGIVQNDKVGDMIINVEIRIPKSLTLEEIELYKKLAKLSSTNIRDIA